MMNTSCIIIVLCLIQISGASESWIVEGKIVKPHSRKYMASLQQDGLHFCGGFLIREDFVLTAAHCKRLPTVVLGAHNIIKMELSQQKIQVEEYFQHPQFTGEFDFDIMLLKLKQKATLNTFVRTIDLPKEDENDIAVKKCTLAGWGQIQPTKGSPPSDVLREAQETIQSNTTCEQTWTTYFNSNNMICTKFSKKRGSMCQGDSGGPLICKNKPVGIAAYTYRDDCSDPQYPHVYTKISSFLPWIKKVMGRLGNASKPLTYSQEINVPFN